MIRTRIIPCLLLDGAGLVKTVRFRHGKYLGDPINIVRIFNDKEVDEIFLLDIAVARSRRPPGVKMIEQIASECFMPMAYGGGVGDLAMMKALFGIGIEKVVVNTAAAERPELVREAADEFGSQSVVVSIDVRRNWLGKYRVCTHGGIRNTGREPVEYATAMARQGAGEILLNSVDRDGAMTGYDLDLIHQVANAVDVPVVACGGAGSAADLGRAVREGGAAAAAAGSIFVFQGPHRAVLISYPSDDEQHRLFQAENPA